MGSTPLLSFPLPNFPSWPCHPLGPQNNSLGGQAASAVVCTELQECTSPLWAGFPTCFPQDIIQQTHQRFAQCWVAWLFGRHHSVILFASTGKIIIPLDVLHSCKQQWALTDFHILIFYIWSSEHACSSSASLWPSCEVLVCWCFALSSVILFLSQAAHGVPSPLVYCPVLLEVTWTQKVQGAARYASWWSSPPTGVCFCPLSSFRQKLRALWTGEMKWALWGQLCYDLPLRFKIFQRCVCLA